MVVGLEYIHCTMRVELDYLPSSALVQKWETLKDSVIYKRNEEKANI